MWNLRKLSRQNFHNSWDNFSLKINSRMLLFYHARVFRDMYSFWNCDIRMFRTSWPLRTTATCVRTNFELLKISGGNLCLSIDRPRNGQVSSTRQAKNGEYGRPKLWMSVGRKWTAVVWLMLSEPGICARQLIDLCVFRPPVLGYRVLVQAKKGKLTEKADSAQLENCVTSSSA